MAQGKLLGEAQGVVIVGACAMASEPSTEKVVATEPEPAQSEMLGED